MWEISETSLLSCLNWAIITGDLVLDGNHRWKLKKSETDQEKEVHPDFVLVDESGTKILAVPCLIELGIRADCIEDRGDRNSRYKVIP